MSTDKIEAVSLADIVETEIPDEPWSETPAETPAPKRTGQDTCQTCGKDITYMYKGKGRRPKYCEEHKPNTRASNLNPGGTRVSTDVKAAGNTLDMGYQALSMVLMMTGAHGAMEALNASLPGLKQQNETFLSQDKDLVKRINAMGKTGGRYAFFAAQAMVLGPVAVIAARELRERFGGSVEDIPETGEPMPATMGGAPIG